MVGGVKCYHYIGYGVSYVLLLRKSDSASIAKTHLVELCGVLKSYMELCGVTQSYVELY